MVVDRAIWVLEDEEADVDAIVEERFREKGYWEGEMMFRNTLRCGDMRGVEVVTLSMEWGEAG